MGWMGGGQGPSFVLLPKAIFCLVYCRVVTFRLQNKSGISPSKRGCLPNMPPCASSCHQAGQSDPTTRLGHFGPRLQLLPQDAEAIHDDPPEEIRAVLKGDFQLIQRRFFGPEALQGMDIFRVELGYLHKFITFPAAF